MQCLPNVFIRDQFHNRALCQHYQPANRILKIDSCYCRPRSRFKWTIKRMRRGRGAVRQGVMTGSAMSTIVTRLMATLSCLGTTCVPCEGCAMGTWVPRVSHVMGPYESLATRPGVSPRRQLMVEGTSGDTCNWPNINSRSNPRHGAICCCQYLVVRELCNVIIVGGVRLCQAILGGKCRGSGPAQQECPLIASVVE